MSIPGRWIHVEGRERCQRCGDFVSAAWKYFPRPALWTVCYCDSCTEELISE